MITKKVVKAVKETKKKVTAKKAVVAKPKKAAKVVTKKEVKPKRNIEKVIHSIDKSVITPIATSVIKVEKHVEKPIETVSLMQEKKPEVVRHHVIHKPQPFKKNPPKKNTFHTSGGRKTSSARVWVSVGTGKYLINGRSIGDYACNRRFLLNMAMEPFVLTDTVGKFDVKANVASGGIVSQIGAVRQAVSKAISLANPELRTVLRRSGLLTRDPRVKERKKYGQKKARKRFQFSKR